MAGVSDAGSIRVLLGRPPVLRTFVFALLGRLAYGVLPLCFLFTVREAAGSFAIAAASSAIFGFATLAMPAQTRLVDRHGQRRVLPIYAALYTSLLVLGAILTPGVSTAAVWLGLGLLLGLTAPALGPAMRAQWREIADEGPQRRRAYSLDSVGEESLYLLGPIVAAAVLATGPPWTGLLLAAGLVACGTTALVLSPYRPSGAGTHEALSTTGAPPRRGPVLRPLLSLMATLALFGASSASVFVGIAALADRAGSPGVAGIIEAAIAAGAVVGGMMWANFGTAERPRRALAPLLIGLALTQAGTAGVTASLVLVGVLLAGGALATSPIFVIAFSTADDIVAAHQRTEASTWVTVGANAGTAAGTAVAGVAVGLSGAAPFLLAATLTVSAALIAVNSARKGPAGSV